jgi:protein O-GlcNAc transferase
VSELSELLTHAAGHAAAGRLDDALVAYRSVLSLSPALAEAHFNIGALLCARGDRPGAEQAFETAARHRPQWAAPALALGHLQFQAGRYADAQGAFERALALDPGSIEAMGNLALTLQRRGRADLAQPHLERARSLAPGNVNAWFALRTNFLMLGRLDEAVQDFRRFEAGAPLSAELVVTGLMFSRLVGDAASEAKYLPLALDWPYRPDQADLAAVTVSRMQYCDVPRDVIYRMYQTYNRLQQSNRGALAPSIRSRQIDGVIRVGYLSADFREHIMGRLLRDVFAAHDRSQVSVHLYSLTPTESEDSLSAEFRALAQSFSALAELDDASAARSIAADGVDILVDLMGHSAGSRPGILLGKPAPVIATHLGYHGCIGMEQVDYKITDAFADLPDAGAYQLEAPLVLDACVLPVRRVAPAAPIVSRAELGVSPSAIVFGTFVSLLKLSPRCLTLWRQILERVPAAVLAFSPLKADDGPLIRRRLAAFGILAPRVVFVPAPRNDAEGRARYRLVDAVLDTLPYTGGDTSAAALDMGVPVVTRVGERHAERVGYSLLMHLGVTDTVAHSDDDYVAIACRLAQDVAWREKIASDIVASMATSGLADPARHARSLEAAYRRAFVVKAA